MVTVGITAPADNGLGGELSFFGFLTSLVLRWPFGMVGSGGGGMAVIIGRSDRSDRRMSGMPTRPRHTALARLGLVLLLLLLLWLVFDHFGLRAQISVASVRQGFAQHWLLGLASFALLFALGNLVHIPGWVFLAAAVLALGRSQGGLVTYVAACLSCLCTFVVVRLVGADALRGLDGRAARWLFARLDAQPVRSVLLLRLLFQTLPGLNCALALSGVGLGAYMLGTLLGLPLPILAMTLLFDSLAHWLHWAL